MTIPVPAWVVSARWSRDENLPAWELFGDAPRIQWPRYGAEQYPPLVELRPRQQGTLGAPTASASVLCDMLTQPAAVSVPIRTHRAPGLVAGRFTGSWHLRKYAASQFLKSSAHVPQIPPPLRVLPAGNPDRSLRGRCAYFDSRDGLLAAMERKYTMGRYCEVTPRHPLRRATPPNSLSLVSTPAKPPQENLRI
jgi:hypothetical protein